MSEEYPDDFLRWARPNPWMQENLAEAYWLWKRRHKGGLPQDKQQKKTAQPTKKKKKNKKKRKGKHVQTPPYVEYMKSPEWKQKSLAWRTEAGKCEHCGSTERLECHYLHYRSLGNETREDIKVLCRDCHQAEHDKQPKRRKKKR